MRCAEVWGHGGRLVVREELDGGDGGPYEGAADFFALFGSACLCERGFNDSCFVCVWQTCEHAEIEFIGNIRWRLEFEQSRHEVFVAGFERFKDERIVSEE